MKRSVKAFIFLGIGLVGSYIAMYFNWGVMATYSVEETNMELIAIGVLIILYFILREIEDINE